MICFTKSPQMPQNLFLGRRYIYTSAWCSGITVVYYSQVQGRINKNAEAAYDYSSYCF